MFIVLLSSYYSLKSLNRLFIPQDIFQTHYIGNIMTIVWKEKQLNSALGALVKHMCPTWEGDRLCKDSRTELFSEVFRNPVVRSIPGYLDYLLKAQPKQRNFKMQRTN